MFGKENNLRVGPIALSSVRNEQRELPPLGDKVRQGNFNDKFKAYTTENAPVMN